MKKSTAGIYIIFLFGVLWHSLPATFNYVLFLTPWVLLLSFIIILYPEIKRKNYKPLIWLSIVYILTFFIEVYGVRTGDIFGSYSYGKTLGFKVLDVPIIIGLNWGILIWGCTELAGKLKLSLPVKILAASGAAVFLDFLIEPAAMYLNYWNWNNGVIPFQNYAAWFVIAMLFSGSYYLLKLKSTTPLGIHFYISQLLFFTLLNLIVV